MPIIASINDVLGIRIHHLSGWLTPDEFLDQARFYRANPRHVRTDVITFVDEHADGAHADFIAQIPALRAEFRDLHMSADLSIVRRSAFVCPNPRVWPHLETWLHERHSHDGQATELCLVPSLDLAQPMFEPDELRHVAESRGFRRLFEIDHRALR